MLRQQHGGKCPRDAIDRCKREYDYGHLPSEKDWVLSVLVASWADKERLEREPERLELFRFGRPSKCEWMTEEDVDGLCRVFPRVVAGAGCLIKSANIMINNSHSCYEGACQSQPSSAKTKWTVREISFICRTSTLQHSSQVSQ